MGKGRTVPRWGTLCDGSPRVAPPSPQAYCLTGFRMFLKTLVIPSTGKEKSYGGFNEGKHGTVSQGT
jgi:hypothetical protein